MRKIDISVIKLHGTREDERLHVAVFGDIAVEEAFGALVCNAGTSAHRLKL